MFGGYNTINTCHSSNIGNKGSHSRQLVSWLSPKVNPELKGRKSVPILPEDTTKSCRNETFSGIGHGPLYHDGFCSFLLHLLSLLLIRKAPENPLSKALI